MVRKIILITIVFFITIILSGMYFYIDSKLIPLEERGPPKFIDYVPPLDSVICFSPGETDPSNCVIRDSVDTVTIP